MKTLFAKYNRERLPKFQTVTKIVELADGSRKAIKQALMPEAQQHIAEIYANYACLTAKYPQIKLVPPTLEDVNTVTFPMAQGVSLESLLKQALDKQDQPTFFALLDKFVAYVDSFVTERQVKFVPCEKFKQVFGEWTLDEPQDLIEFANVDMIFSNLFVADDASITQIDYEWVFDFKIPKSIITDRAFGVFIICNNHMNLLGSYILERYKQISLEFFLFNYNIFDAMWLNYIMGSKNLYSFNHRVIKQREHMELTIQHLRNLDQLYNPWRNAVVQLFYDVVNGFNSKNYLEQAIQEGLNCYEFSLNKVYDLKGLRLDPINLPAHIQLISARLFTKDGSFYSLKIAWHNANNVFNDRYSFYHDDPILVFDWSQLGAFDCDRVVFEFKLELIDVHELSNFVVQQLASLRTKNAELSSTQSELSSTQSELSSTQSELSSTQSELSSTQSELSSTQSELKCIYSSRSWKIISPFRKLIN